MISVRKNDSRIQCIKRKKSFMPQGPQLFFFKLIVSLSSFILKVTDVCSRTCASLGRHCPKLVHLDLDSCALITNNSLKSLR